MQGAVGSKQLRVYGSKLIGVKKTIAAPRWNRQGFLIPQGEPRWNSSALVVVVLE